MTTYKDLAEYLQDLSHITKGAGREKVIQTAAILRSLDAQRPTVDALMERVGRYGLHKKSAGVFRQAPSQKGEVAMEAHAADRLAEIRTAIEALAAPVAAQASMPLSDSHPLAVFAQECAIGAHDYGGLRLAAQNALKAAHGIKERG